MQNRVDILKNIQYYEYTNTKDVFKKLKKEKNDGRLGKENKKSQESDSSTYPARPRNRNSTLSRKNDSRIIILEERAKALTLF